MIEENARLRSTQPRSPTTPTSPLPVIFEPPAAEGEEGEVEPIEVYAQVDMSKVSLEGRGMGGQRSTVVPLCRKRRVLRLDHVLARVRHSPSSKPHPQPLPMKPLPLPFSHGRMLPPLPLRMPRLHSLPRPLTKYQQRRALVMSPLL